MANEELQGSWIDEPSGQLLLLHSQSDIGYQSTEHMLERTSQKESISANEPCLLLHDRKTRETHSNSQHCSMSASATTCQEDENSIACPICHNEYRSPSELKEHFKNHGPNNQEFICWESGCSFMSQDRKQFQAHLKRTHSVTPVACSQRACRLLFASQNEMSVHFRSHFPFHCNRCDFVSSNTKQFSQHKKDHSEEERSTTEALESKQPRSESAREEATESQQPPGKVEMGKEHLYKTHMCPECKRCFKKRTHLAEHLNLHFPDPNLQCPNCDKYFTSRSKLKIHLMRESGQKTHQCPLCEYSSVERNALNRHMASIHEGVSNLYSDTYSCPVCQETFKLSQALKEHLKGHREEQKMLSCFHQGCNKSLSDRKEFLKHLKESHGIRAVECRYHACSLLFRNREEMEKHRKNHYAFHCQECDFVCSNKHAFRKHKKCGHPGSEELFCLFCPYKSFNPVEFSDHLSKMHASEKIHRCEDCEFATAHKRVLIRHMLLHTGEKPHKCNLCDFTCRDISYLSKHMLTHSTDKNYMCTECGYVTKWKHYLSVHMRKHSGDLRFQCNQCSYRCHRADQLTSHKLRHQGKNIICEVCGFGCKRKYELQKHMKIKHSQSFQMTIYQCQHCSYQTKYKQSLLNHENCKHTKHKEFCCALCPYRTFSNTSLFFHKRKSHGYVPGDKDWLEKYANKQHELETDLLLLYKTKGCTSSGAEKFESDGSPVEMLKHVELDSQTQSNLDGSVADSFHDGITEPGGHENISVADESLLATITLEPVETCSIEMEGFPVQLQLSAPTELSKESSIDPQGTCEEPLSTTGEMLCFSETLAVENNVICEQNFVDEHSSLSKDQDKLENAFCSTEEEYNQEPILCNLNDKSKELPVHVGASLTLQADDLPVEMQESWTGVLKEGLQLTIVCESNDLLHADHPEEENSPVYQGEPDDSGQAESVLRALRKQDKEQAETLVLEGRVQMLVVQSNAQVYKCEKCSYITRKEGCMLQHSKTGCLMRKASLVCMDCGASFKQQRGLNTHQLKKCPATRKKKIVAVRSASSSEPSVDLETANKNLLLEKTGENDQENNISNEVLILETHDPNILESSSLNDVGHLTSCQDLLSEEYKEKMVTLDKGEAGTIFSSLPFVEPPDAALMPVDHSEKYKLEQGKFHCLFCSFSCSRECTISNHVKEGCRGLKTILCALCSTVLTSKAALRKHQQEQHGELFTSDKCSESSVDEESQNTEEDEDRNRDEVETTCKSNNVTSSGCRLSCSTCPFTCSQDRAMRTHKKKGCLRPGELQCSLCSFRCMTTVTLKHHQDLHKKYSRNRVHLQCKQCDFTCKQPRCMKQHVRIRHEGVKPHRCRYCEFSTTRRYRLDAHESLHTGVGRISCNSCTRTFGTNSKLRLHQLRVHEKKPSHFCGLCDYSGYSQNDIARHMGSCHSGELSFPCSVCQASFSSEAALKQHSLRKHQEKATHECSQCQFSCHSLSTLKCHLQKEHLQLECGICKEIFSRRQQLDEHRKSHFAHHCQQCQYAAKDRQQLVRHYSEEHEISTLPGTEGEEGPLRCPFCSFSCHHQLVYDHHVKGHGGTRVYKCSDCAYSTRNKQKITWHSRIHTGEKPYKCHLCTYACADPSRLKHHMRIHKDEKKYLCPECGYKCKWVNQLKYHMTKHTGLKPYQCEECDYCTNRADALRVHRETRHRDVRAFICEQCGKAFKTRFLLKTHLKKHSEEKPYVCTVCQRGFRWPAGLRHHYLTHTNQQPFFCQYCSYRAKQKFQVVKHIQRHHPGTTDLTKGIGKDPYSMQSCDATHVSFPQTQ
ncbi:zinc finger protein 142 isoform X2 [Bombina bombina]|uniref:zinc finger protein 142 isoform X2 n=1 Tax=Bombina bombina TaxID=8345 RepID=UPI00235B13BC|nr:zinc finger protein 142 isoform X2 [Bombina bombina]